MAICGNLENGKGSVELVECEGGEHGRRWTVGGGRLAVGGSRCGAGRGSGARLPGVGAGGGLADELPERGEEGMGGVGAVVPAVAVAFADNELRGGELGQLGLDRTEGEAAAAGELAQVQLGGSVGEEQPQDLGADLGKEDGEQIHDEWLKRTDDWIKRTEWEASRKAEGGPRRGNR